MNATRYAPHSLRAAYLRALQAAPMRVRLADPVEADRLTILGAATIAGRTVHFGTAAVAPRLWIAFADLDPALIGYMTGLVVGEPQLWVSTDAHWAWTTEAGHAAELKHAAARVWFDCQRTCEG